MKPLTRRNLFAAAAAVAAAAPSTKAQAQAATSRDADLKDAREAIANNAAQIAKVKVPIAIEPAFIFKA